MLRPPRRRHERLVSYKTFIRSYGIIGPIEALLSFCAFFYILHSGGWAYGERILVDNVLYAQATGAFLTTIIFCQVGNVLACRTNRQSAIPYLVKLNSWIIAGVLFELLFCIMIVNVPLFHHFFTTAPIAVEIWVAMLLAPVIVFVIEELRKLLVRHGVTILAV